jgi:hypothetical protein
MQKEASNYGFNIITGIIPSKFDNTCYTKNAQILQCILQYSVKSKPDYYFDIETISKNYLLKECRYYINLYEGSNLNIPSRYKEIKEEVFCALEQLTCLDVLYSKSADTNNNLGSKRYKFTRVGKLLGFLLSFKNDSKCSLEQLYKHLLGYFAEENYSYAKLCFVILKNLHNASSPLFIGMTNSLIGLLENANNDKNSFIDQIKKYIPSLDRSSWDILYKSLGEIDYENPLLYEVLLYNLKLDLEEFNEFKSYRIRRFERVRFNSREDPFFVTLEGRCNRCRLYTVVKWNLIDYLRKFANRDPNDKFHKTVYFKCKNSKCENGFVNFEYVSDVKHIRILDSNKKPDKKRDLLRLMFIENHADIIGTIFEKTDDNNFTIRSKRIQAILEFLLDNQDKPYKTRAIVQALLIGRKELFPTVKDVSTIDSDIVDNFHDQFQSYMEHLKAFVLVDYKKVPSEKNEKEFVDEFQINKFGKAIAVLAKIERCNYNSKTIDIVYITWQEFFDDHPFSLDLFCKIYFQLCKEANLFEDFIKIFYNYLHNNTSFYSLTDLFTQIIFFRFDNDDSKNEKLYQLWKQAWLQIKGDDGNLFMNHVRLYIHKIIGKKVHNFAKFEIARYENRSCDNMVVIEANCRNCTDEYVHIPVPLVLYLPYLFYDKTDAQIFTSIKTYGINCQKCKECDFSFILI